MRIKVSRVFYSIVVLTILFFLWNWIHLDNFSRIQRFSGGDAYYRMVTAEKPLSTASHENNSRVISEVAKTTYDKVIVGYTMFYGRLFNVSLLGRTKYDREILPDPMKACKYRCRWSTDKSEFSTADSVIFHMYNNDETHKDFLINQIPARTNPDQKWVLMAREPPAFFYPEQLKLLDNTFNLTITYQQDSDVRIPYGKYWLLPGKALMRRTKKKLDYMKGKKKLIAWMASNCKTSSRREEYVRQLQKYIPIDIYGKCGNFSTGIESANGFRKVIARRYLFYIAFENSDCDDYISEKFWNSLHIGIIPIVRGLRSNYKKFAPPNSYIQVESFVSPEQLAAHLKEISQNSTLFHQYHQWRLLYDANYKFFTSNKEWMCDLCREVHTSPRKTVSIYEHFSEDRRCLPYLDYKGRDRAGENVQDLTY